MENQYIEARMPFIRRLAESGRAVFSGSDLAKARDKTTAIVQKLLFLQAEEAHLRHRHRTLECVNITTKGKIEVFDPSG